MTDRPRSLVIVTPVFNDWTAFDSLVGALERALADAGLTAHLLAVDDGSSEDAPEQLTHVLEAITGVEVLQLRRNLGHQRAIAIGLAFIRRRAPCDVIVMDSDGEDDPADVPRLLARLDQEKGRVVVFAERLQSASV